MEHQDRAITCTYKSNLKKNNIYRPVLIFSYVLQWKYGIDSFFYFFFHLQLFYFTILEKVFWFRALRSQILNLPKFHCSHWNPFGSRHFPEPICRACRESFHSFCIPTRLPVAGEINVSFCFDYSRRVNASRKSINCHPPIIPGENHG